jgi:hypothetical protein
MPTTIELVFHVKRHTDFELLRIIKAQEQGFDEPVTAYLCGVAIRACTGIGVVFVWFMRKGGEDKATAFFSSMAVVPLKWSIWASATGRN